MPKTFPYGIALWQLAIQDHYCVRQEMTRYATSQLHAQYASPPGPRKNMTREGTNNITKQKRRKINKNNSPLFLPLSKEVTRSASSPKSDACSPIIGAVSYLPPAGNCESGETRGKRHVPTAIMFFLERKGLNP